MEPFSGMGKITQKRHKQHTRQGEGVDIFTVVAARHELLAETNSVLALGDIVEDLELLLRDALNA